MSEISETLLKQRLRNRIIESLDDFADESSVGILGTDEIIEVWYDYVDSERISFYDAPIFSPEEIDLIHRFHDLIERTYNKVPSTWNVDELSDSKEWSELASIASEGLMIFNIRGRFDEDNEVI